jgi:hypothetical protein
MSTQPPLHFIEPLYEGANISVCATYCAIMEFSILLDCRMRQQRSCCLCSNCFIRLTAS